MVNEIWKKVEGYENIYEVSNHGNIQSIDHFVVGKKSRTQKGRVLSVSISTKGYHQVSLSLLGRRFHTGVHRLVAKAFLANPDNKEQVNHKDGNKSNNHVSNLEWATNQENIIHAYKNNLVKLNYGEKHHQCRFTNNQIKELKRKLANGVSGSSISKEYKISQAAVSQIKKGKTYKNIA